jgi:hypothetical protein
LRAGDAFAWKAQRILSQALTLQYEKPILILEPDRAGQGIDRQAVTVIEYPDGWLTARYSGADLASGTVRRVIGASSPT